MLKTNCSPQAQRRRCERVTKSLAEKLLDEISHDGQWAAHCALLIREQIYCAQVLLRSREPETAYRANRILEKAALCYHEFIPMILLMILHRSADLLEAEVRKRVDRYLEENIPAFQGGNGLCGSQ